MEGVNWMKYYKTAQDKMCGKQSFHRIVKQDSFLKVLMEKNRF